MKYSEAPPGRRARQDLEVRQRLLAAARAELLEHGYHGASLDRIAARADCTKGTVYSKYESKADLVLALIEQRQDERLDRIVALVDDHGPEAPLADVLAALAVQGARLNQADAAWRLLVTELRTVAARDDGIGERYAALHQALLDRLEVVLVPLFARSATPPVLRPREAAQLMLALEVGTGMEQLVDPDSLGPDVARRLVSRLFEEAT